MEEIAEAVFLTKGMREVTGLTMGFVLDTPIGIMLTSHSMEDEAGVDPESARLPVAVRERFEALRWMLRDRCTASTLATNSNSGSDSHSDDPDTLETCEKALEDLEEIYRNLRYFKRKGRLQNGHLWRWPVRFPPPHRHLLISTCNDVPEKSRLEGHSPLTLQTYTGKGPPPLCPPPRCLPPANPHHRRPLRRRYGMSPPRLVRARLGRVRSRGYREGARA